jgi:hypothetical protein
MTSDSITKRTDYSANVIYQDGNYPKGEEKFKAISNMGIEAYKMQYSYDKSFPGTVSSLKDIDVHSVGEIMNGGSHVYDAIYQYSIFLKERNKIKNQ